MKQKTIISVIATILAIFSFTSDNGPIDMGNMILVLISIWMISSLFNR